MNVHNVKNIGIVANITNDNKLVFEEALVNYFEDDNLEVNVFTLHKPTPDEYETMFREECK
jgi:ABC-type uncharacterized transport system substrate-binding protein